MPDNPTLGLVWQFIATEHTKFMIDCLKCVDAHSVTMQPEMSDAEFEEEDEKDNESIQKSEGPNEMADNVDESQREKLKVQPDDVEMAQENNVPAEVKEGHQDQEEEEK